MTKAFVTGCSGLHLTSEESLFIEKERPWGLILFARNIDTPQQVSELTQSFREIIGSESAPVLVDQEGGRVQRLKPPHWRKYPAAKFLGDLYDIDPLAAKRAAWLNARLIAHDLVSLGITIDCIPCLDVRFEATVDAIGDRAISSNPEVVAELGAQLVKGATDGGILPVIKHIPGHGRACVDSHFELPKVAAPLSVLESCDFVPFKALAGVPLGMTAHIVFEGIDNESAGTQSRTLIQDVIRGRLGFDGCLMTDDISMKALGGSLFERSQKVIEAGCDIVLHCNGDMSEMREVAAAVPELKGKSATRCAIALKQLQEPVAPFDPDATWEEFLRLMSLTTFR